MNWRLILVTGVSIVLLAAGLPACRNSPPPEPVLSVREAGCPSQAPVRSYSVAAIQVEITLNRYLDHDPRGRMFVLEGQIERVRDEEGRNRKARTEGSEPAVSAGLQRDAIQPLVLRVNQGECLRIALRNEMPDNPVNLTVPDSEMVLKGTQKFAGAANTGAIAMPGQTVEYEWYVRPETQEGTHALYTTVMERAQRDHGLFGALIIEPAGSKHFDPLSGAEGASGWMAIVQPPAGPAFREFVPIYHEVGDETYQPLDRTGSPITQVDNLSEAYRPATRALNYRSEPFMNRLALQDSLFGRFDLSLAYSSYSFGDPATPIARAYLGDPVVLRLVDGSSEVFHVHHLHGGSIRWLRQPSTGNTRLNAGLDKHPPIFPENSTFIDSQALGPGSAFDAVSECGAGGCQQSAGDFLFHCHIAQHYLAGMWGILRTYNTLQDGVASTDRLPPLAPLPDRSGAVAAAVTSDQLVGTEVSWNGKLTPVTPDNLRSFVERQLPPRGKPQGYDASVLDWDTSGLRYLNEPESERSWPGYAPQVPGARPPIRFDPKTGRLAYPLLQPHLAKRPPFAPDHGPAPYLDPPDDSHQHGDVAWDGGTCPEGTTKHVHHIEAITVPVVLNQRLDLVDPLGELFVLKEDVARVRSDPTARTPLVLRANAGEDCVDVVLSSDLQHRGAARSVTKADIHIHFVQFDIQASDGLNTGFNYEQTVSSYRERGTAVTSAVKAGANRIAVEKVDGLHPGSLIGIGLEESEPFEVRRIVAIESQDILLDQPLDRQHGPGAIVSPEFVRYRWYVDAQVGTAYFHDHVHASQTWRHGLFGALIVEPPGSTYHDPGTGEVLRSGPIADIRTESPVAADLSGSFREMVLLVQDDNPVTRVGKSTGSSINLRVEPLRGRSDDPSMLFSSSMTGDPETPLLRAYTGDPLVIRTLVTGTNDVHALHTDGQWFRPEAMSLKSQPTTSIPIGISERFDLMVPSAGGPRNVPGDYMYFNGRYYKLQEGSWGIIRVSRAGEAEGLQPLPSARPTVAASTLCPADAPLRHFEVSAIEARLPMLRGSTGRIFALSKDVEAIKVGTKVSSPLVLHVNSGDCITVSLHNGLTDGRVSFHVDRLAYDPAHSQGISAGYMTDQSVAEGDTRMYTYYADPSIGEVAALVTDWGDPVRHQSLGMYGAVVIGPADATYTDPGTGADASAESLWAVDVHVPGRQGYRDFTLLMHDQDPIIGTQVMPYSLRVDGTIGINYTAEPLARRLQADPDPTTLFDCTIRGDPATPLMRAYAGDSVRVHVAGALSEQAQVFSIEAHSTPLEPMMEGADLLGSLHVGSGNMVDLHLTAGAGGPSGLSGDFVYGNHRGPFLEAGMWGIFRVLPRGIVDQALIPLPSSGVR